MDSSRVRKDVVHLDSVKSRRVPVLKLFWVSDYRDVTGKCQRAIAIRRADFVAVDKEHASMHSLQRHRRSVKLLLRMLSHDHKLQLIRLGCSNDLAERAGAMTAEKRVHMDHAFVLAESGLFLAMTFGIELLNSGAQAAEFVASVSKRNLREQQQ